MEAEAAAPAAAPAVVTAAAAAPAPAPVSAAAPPPPPGPVPAAAAAEAPVKRRRGRPRKSELPPSDAAQKAGADPSKPRKQRKRKGEAAAGGAPATVDVAMIGQQVTGVLDGTFDAGYLLTVRVGASDTILRGVVFGPGLSVPVSRANDVAPGVKHVRREDRPAPVPSSKLPIAAKPPPPSKLPIVPPPSRSLPLSLPLASHIPPTQAVLENAAALFTNAVTASAPPPPPAPITGLVAALQQLPGGGYTPDASTFSQTTFQSI